ncbi:CHAT domain-containing protein [Streptantibioticus ferralitis]|uniref:Tetratricopeptide repeat protein n=1 Tax=Streptantibioticus ferralitis TaxID=236510 RepID=A0ABT5Z3E6_9ACTN|nr:CHAT domain-containing protein [Streptantibioticus ferralitis]MDF2258350.1 tetratricopeptide repeat protein [Streptantibioticus ferralitis]
MIFERSGDQAVLAEAVQVGREAVSATPLDHPNRATLLNTLGTALQNLYQWGGDRAVLEEGVQVLREAVSTAPGDHPHRAMFLNNLGIALRKVFERDGDQAALEKAVQVGREAVSATAPDHPNRATFLNTLGLALHKLFERSGDRLVLEEAVQVGRDAVHAIPPDHPDQAICLNNLGNVLRVLFDRGGDQAVLEEAVQAGREAVRATPPDHPNRATYLNNLGLALQKLFERSGDRLVLEEAVQVGRDAVHATPPDHPDQAARLSNLGRALLRLFERGGDQAVLEEAVQAGREAVRATPPDHPDQAMYLNNLGSSLESLFQQSGDQAVLAEAVQVAREAVRATPHDRPDRAMPLSTLGLALLGLFERAGDQAVGQEAVQVARDAVRATPPDHPDQAMYLNNLGSSLQSLFWRGGDQAVGEQAVQIAREAVRATAPDHPNLAPRLSTLGNALRKLVDQGGDQAVLEEAVQVGRDAVSATPPDHPNRAMYLNNLGISLQSLFEWGGGPAVLEEGRNCCATAAGIASASVATRVSAARLAASLDLLAGEHDHAVEMAELAVELLPRLAPRALARADREHRIVSIAGLASAAATAAIAAGRPERAVELLEQTRGVLLADTLDTRSDLTDLWDREPDLATEFEDIREAIEDADHAHDRLGIPTIEAPGRPGGVGRPDYRNLAARRAGLHQRWTDLLGRIRERPGFDGFLRPPPIDQLRRQTDDNPIVYVTVHDEHGHALIVADDPVQPVRVVDLPNLSEYAAAEHIDQLRTAQQTALDGTRPARERSAAQRQILDVLSWLWDTITEPVLRHLGYTTSPDDDPWPRIWWCPVGICTYLPLHAAGHHTSTTRADTVMDRVISSYTPTIRALAHTRTPRRQPQPSSASTPAMLIVAVPDAPASRPLHSVLEEVEILRRLVPTTTMLPPPGTPTTHDNVTAALPSHQIAHFACHGVADWATPANSRLLLHDHLDQPLTVAGIARLRLTHADMAYLSACSTTDTNPDHADEATHITAAFHLAGYRSVIGTLWPVNDRVATVITHDVYAYLTHSGTRPPDTALAAHALHHTTRQHRDRYPTAPTRWAAHIHTGT